VTHSYWKEERHVRSPFKLYIMLQQAMTADTEPLKKLPQKALFKVKFRLKILILSYSVTWFAVHRQKSHVLKTLYHM